MSDDEKTTPPGWGGANKEPAQNSETPNVFDLFESMNMPDSSASARRENSSDGSTRTSEAIPAEEPEFGSSEWLLQQLNAERSGDSREGLGETEAADGGAPFSPSFGATIDAPTPPISAASAMSLGPVIPDTPTAAGVPPSTNTPAGSAARVGDRVGPRAGLDEMMTAALKLTEAPTGALPTSSLPQAQQPAGGVSAGANNTAATEVPSNSPVISTWTAVQRLLGPDVRIVDADAPDEAPVLPLIGSLGRFSRSGRDADELPQTGSIPTRRAKLPMQTGTHGAPVDVVAAAGGWGMALHLPNDRATRWLLGIVTVFVLLAVISVGFLIGRSFHPTVHRDATSVASESPSVQASSTPSVTPTLTPTPVITPTGLGSLPAGTYSWDQLLGGECIDPFTNAWATDFTVVDCASSHQAQLVYTAAFSTDPAAPYPGATELAAQIPALCTRPGILKSTQTVGTTNVQLSIAYPATAAQWQSGQRNYYCFVSLGGGASITGSLAGAGPTS